MVAENVIMKFSGLFWLIAVSNEVVKSIEAWVELPPKNYVFGLENYKKRMFLKHF